MPFDQEDDGCSAQTGERIRVKPRIAVAWVIFSERDLP